MFDFFLLPWSFGCTTTQTRESKPREWRVGGGMQTLVECATKKVPIIVISSYKEAEQNTCPSPEADAGTVIVPRSSALEGDVLVVIQVVFHETQRPSGATSHTHPHKQLDKPAPTFSKGQSVDVLWNRFIQPPNKKRFTLGPVSWAKSLVLAATCEHAYVFAKVCMHIQCQFYKAPHVIHTYTKRGEASVLQSMYIIISAEKNIAVYNISSGRVTLHFQHRVYTCWAL